MELTQWTFGDVAVLEPMTAITDLIVTAVCIVSFVKLKQSSDAEGGHIPQYPYFFLTMGLCTFFAALMTHAFPYTMVNLLDKSQVALLPWEEKFTYHLHDLPNWLLNISSASLFEWSLVDRASELVLDFPRRRWLALISAESIIVLVLLLWHLSYNVAAIHIVFTLYAVLVPLQIITMRHHSTIEQKLHLLGAGVMLFSGLVMATKFQFSPWFNHNDISHIIIAISMFLFYKSAIHQSKINIMEYLPSKLLSDAVGHFSRLPGIGRKTALRLVLDLLKRDQKTVNALAESLMELKANIKSCKICGNLSDDDTCSICSDARRDLGTICVVENIRDVIAIEQTGTYRGTYHILGGLISPIDGIGPGDLNIQQLKERIGDGGIVKELIFALSANMEGDTTCFYLSRLFSGKVGKISQIARGVAFGGDLEYTDELTLARSLESRTIYNA